MFYDTLGRQIAAEIPISAFFIYSSVALLKSNGQVCFF